MSAQWQSIVGATKAQFPLAGEDWTGPERVEVLLDDQDNIKALRGVFTRPDGSKRMAEVRYLARTTKHTFRPYSDQSQ